MSEPYWVALGAPQAEQVPVLVDGRWLAAKSNALVWDQMAMADIVGLQAAYDAKVPLSQKGVAGGIVPLDTQARIPGGHLPDRVAENAAWPSGMDFNNIPLSGWWHGYNMANRPALAGGDIDADWLYFTTQYINDSYQRQEAWSLVGTGAPPPGLELRHWYRQKATTWGAWTELARGS